jgi:hypothetical protein
MTFPMWDEGPQQEQQEQQHHRHKDDVEAHDRDE